MFSIQPIDIQDIIDAVPVRMAAIGIFIVLILRYGNPIKAYKNLKKVMNDKSHIEKAIEESEKRCKDKMRIMESKLDGMQVEIGQCLEDKSATTNQLNSINKLAKEIEESGEEMSPQLISKFFKVLSQKLNGTKDKS